ncbi:MAG: tRNA preQ1(34) S-adenosylmethionine ribosyltransferase-isomerase QueA [Anaerolineales bacterium]|nr:tRNA preQ1(34) S-adenosylmethionine ribosyltransferase-isomerase QueA [Anaerolineales bacterium]
MKTSDFDYDLPPEYIAQTPIEPRDQARLMVLDRAVDKLRHVYFYQLGEFLRAGDVLVLNETRVIPARLYGRKIPGGGKVELLLLKKWDEQTWEALVGGKGLRVGRQIQLDGGRLAEVAAEFNGSRRLVRFDEPIEAHLARIGQTPLPPYIHAPLADAERYQTVYSRQPGSVAAPTAGLHFTPRLIDQLKAQGVNVARVTLHIGLDTFAPVTEEDAEQHHIHSEWCELDEDAAEAIRRARQSSGRVIAVGTTSVRTLESAASRVASGQIIAPFRGETNLYILPGYRFRIVDAMITNFHLPKSTLIMLVSAFAGRERVLAAYEEAKSAGYRFYSFGDAMLIL